LWINYDRHAAHHAAPGVNQQLPVIATNELLANYLPKHRQIKKARIAASLSV
jgi:hypothetical protein